MRKSIQFLFLAFVAAALASCDMFNKNTPSYSLSDLQGKWLEDGTQHYVRFTTESAADLKAGYLWGYEWDLDDSQGLEVLESDVLADKHGNGWFMYQLSADELLEINKMNQGWADIPKVYVVTALNSSRLTYYLKGYKNEKVSFTKQ
jgi:hypothetical protein